ncbi:MAG: uncharacterized protein KVP18_000300 [Porospora cf. gigantea A]|uniref:uncharacterized protein n=1 Tax=Porospora cf. gigantea A TaxID=2853593 RepID=UPI00355A5BD4|nr:MAG: hypothetical protein KVP18_000300 [Porospora cf. gigantea A]
MEEVLGGRPYACPEVVLDKMPHVHRMSYRVSMRAKTAEVELRSRMERVRVFAHGGRNYVYVRRYVLESAIIQLEGIRRALL